MARNQGFVDRNKVYAIQLADMDRPTGIALYAEMGYEGFNGICYLTPPERGHMIEGKLERRQSAASPSSRTGARENGSLSKSPMRTSAATTTGWSKGAMKSWRRSAPRRNCKTGSTGSSPCSGPRFARIRQQQTGNQPSLERGAAFCMPSKGGESHGRTDV